MDLENVSWDHVINARNVNSSWERFKRTVLSICDRYAPFMTKKVRGLYCPWLSSEIKELIKERDYLGKAQRSDARK